jgi:cytosine/adenosine deaminase-related metal-dependent hydrolase
VFPISGPPLEWGRVSIAGERIVAVEPPPGRLQAARPGAHKKGRWGADVDLGESAVLPGLVNAHTHLDLTGLRGLAPPSEDFTAWLRQVIAHRRSRPAEQVEADVCAGLAESLRFGTTLLGDIAAGGGSWPVLSESPIRSVVFHELLGLTRQRAEQALRAARDWLASHPATSTCRPGLSPHAPYSVRESLFVEAAMLARDSKCPLAVHLAESHDELELLQHRRGPFVPFLQGLGVWGPDGLVRSPTEVLYLCNMGTRNLFIHGNYLAPAARVRGQSTVVYCPRTHAAFGHRPHPLRRLLAQGVRVALGTDSLASNPDLDVLGEARFLHRLYPDLPGETLLRMATLSGAEALGWADETGSLEPGKSADLVVLPLPSGASSDPHALVLASDQPVQRVLCRGRWLEFEGASHIQTR